MKPYLSLPKTTRYHTHDLSSDNNYRLKNTFELHEIVQEDINETSTQDKIDAYDEYIFLVLHIPKYIKERDKYVFNEFNIILGKTFIVTLCDHPSKNIKNIKESYESKFHDNHYHYESSDEYKTSSYYLLYKIIDTMYDKMLYWLRNFTQDLRKIEQMIFEDYRLTPDVLEKIMIKRRNLVLIKHTFLPHKEILEELQKETLKFFWGELEVYFEDLLYKIDKIIWNVEVLNEDIDSLYDAHDALIWMKTNRIITLLTIFTAILWVLTFVTWFYWMNVPLPFSWSSHIAWSLGITMVSIIGWMIRRFYKKNRIY